MSKEAIQNYMRNRKRQLRAAPLRVFPKGSCRSSTNEYVHTYYLMNNLLPMSQSQGVRDLFQPLSTNPTTWPEPEETELDQLITAAQELGKLEIVHIK